MLMMGDDGEKLMVIFNDAFNNHTVFDVGEVAFTEACFHGRVALARWLYGLRPRNGRRKSLGLIIFPSQYPELDQWAREVVRAQRPRGWRRLVLCLQGYGW